MSWLLIAAVVACNAGDRVVDLSGQIPRGLKFIDLIVSVKPSYARFYIYQPGYPDSFMQCCSDKPSGLLRVPVIDGRFCVRQSQPQMKWNVRAVLKSDVEI